MKNLDQKYIDVLQSIQTNIQASESLKSYLDEEDDAFYDSFKQEFEPQIAELHAQVAQSDPLQMEDLENRLLDPAFEGLFLPRILGYSVLRGALNDDYKYIRPQEHFKNILKAICGSFNFDILKNRIGQTIEVGFALSSDIWITNLIAEVDNKMVKSYLKDLKLHKYTDRRSRHTSYLRYAKQFQSFNYLTAELPKTSPELKIEFRSIINFLHYRASLGSDAGNSVYSYIKGILDNASLGTSSEHLEVLLLIGSKFDLQAPEAKLLTDGINAYKGYEEEEIFFNVLGKIQDSDSGLVDGDYARLNGIVQSSELVKFKEFMATINEMESLGYLNQEAVDVARNYHNNNEGLSPQNECLRNFVFNKFGAFMGALSVEDFNEYFELNKVFTTYMNAFDNEQFNQNIKGISMKYVKKLLRRYTDKRGKDYQDIKKFVSAVFLDLGFLKEKEIKELFKTKRKKAASS